MNEKITPIVMPKWGLTMTEGTVVRLACRGRPDDIAVGQEIMDVETDKIANAVEAADGGFLRRRVAQAGQVYPVKSLLGVMAPAEVPESEIDAYVADFKVPISTSDEEERSGGQSLRRDAVGPASLCAASGRGRSHPVHSRVWRRSQQLAVQHRCGHRAGAGLCARPSRPWRVHQGDCQTRPGRAGDGGRGVHARVEAVEGASRRPLVGRRDRGRHRCPGAETGAIADADQSGRARRRRSKPDTSTASWRRNRAAISSRCCSTCSPIRTW